MHGLIVDSWHEFKRQNLLGKVVSVGSIQEKSEVNFT